MKYCVRHRADDGRVAETTVEANDRAGVFEELSRRGITAISIMEGEAKPRWGRRSGISTQRRGGAERRSLGITFSVLVVLLVSGGVAWWLMRSDSADEDEAKDKRKGLIASQTPSKADGRISETDATGEPGEVATSATLPVGEATDDVASTEPPKPKKKFRVIRKDEGKKKLFHNIADIYISRVVNSTPGNLVVGTINYDRFPEQFLKALNEPITIDEDDTPEDIAKKQAVIETRAELKKMLGDGVDIAQVMREAEAEQRRLWNYRRTLHLELAKAMQDGKFNADDMQDYVDAANMMLKDNGMEPLKYPQFWVRRMRQEEAEAAFGR